MSLLFCLAGICLLILFVEYDWLLKTNITTYSAHVTGFVRH